MGSEMITRQNHLSEERTRTLGLKFLIHPFYIQHWFMILLKRECCLYFLLIQDRPKIKKQEKVPCFFHINTRLVICIKENVWEIS